MPDFNFDSLLQVRIPVKYGGANYVLIEASGGAVAKYRDTQMSAASMQKTGDGFKISGMAGVAQAELDLLASSLWFADPKNPDGTTPLNHTISAGVLKNWPNRVLEPLIKELKKISLIDAEDTPSPKDLPTATETGSPSQNVSDSQWPNVSPE